ncbi:Tellurite resistance TerB [Desulfamplus magnetovallimortis]|uniref:Tellurite resistance TerB n=1 Tax=Desulfamplus magnetovallimortis TaxID=1246637 RepID=A0A1W1HAJ8_9BACT|nr:tellurite resistance TerB family protein [Desulfamplus magnetovallimortis]SLM29398.1 Tellurite resistance TerB [Desulfamplus magnetovallimortis]
MGFLSKLKEGAMELQSQLSSQVKQFKNKNFADGTMAVCALVAAADGTIDPDERRKTASFISSNDTLAVFDVSQLQSTFNSFCDKLTKDFDFGKIDLLQVISKLKKTPPQARAAIQVGIIIGNADGNFDAEEKKVVREICQSLDIDPSDFDL